MTARQIRIACCGMVVSTRAFPDPETTSVEKLMLVRDAVMRDFDTARQYGRVAVWIDEAGSNVAHLMGGAR